MSYSEPNRYLLAVGIGIHASDKWPPLPDTEKELQQVVGVLVSETFGYQRILEAESRHPVGAEFLRALDEWCSSSERKPTDHLVVYWTGHGEVSGEQLYLVLPDTRSVLAGAISLDLLAGIVLSETSRVGPALFMLDVCFAAQGAADAGSRWGAWTRQRGTAKAPELGMICAAGAGNTASPLVFADAFTNALTSLVDPDKLSQKAISLTDIQARMGSMLGNRVRFPFSLTGHGDWLFFRNPHRVAHWPAHLDIASERLLTRLENVARGVPTVFSKGWCFKGRQRVFADLCAWLRSGPDRGLCQVTGGLGAGKSAVLARLYTMSRQDYRCNAPAQAIDETELPALGSIAGLILLQKKSAKETFDEVCTKLGLQAAKPNLVAPELARRARLPVLVFDGLDEAERPRHVWDLLQVLAAAGLGVIVGVRSPAPGGKAADILAIDLNAQPWSDPDAIGRYVAERLDNELTFGPSAGPPNGTGLAAIQQAIVEHANGNFLLASLIVTSFTCGQPNRPDAQAWRFPATVGEAFDRIFGQMDEETEEACRDLLTPLAYAEGDGIPDGELWCALASRLSGHEYHLAVLEKVMKKVPWFLQGEIAQGSRAFRLFHVALAEHLQKGRNAADVHALIAATLSAWTIKDAPRAPSSSGDLAYASGHLAAHLRRAGKWHELGELVMTPAWIMERNRDQPIFESAGFAADLEHARQAAADANRQAAQQWVASPALAETGWWLVWRSAQVTLTERAPPAAWPLLVQLGVLSGGEALRLLANISHETRLAAALVLLARSLTGNALDDLLDFAEGAGAAMEKSSGPAPVASRDRPLPLFHEILRAALAGADGERLAERALNAAALAEEYERWLLLDAAMPHFTALQLDVAERLIASMSANIIAEHGYLARAGHAAACAAKGNKRIVEHVKNLHRDSAAWWYASAALLAQEKKTGTDFALGISAAEEILRASSSIVDWHLRLCRMGALVRTLPGVRHRQERQALAVYLRCLHDCEVSDLVVREAAPAARALPAPHGDRLLRWAKHRFLNARTSSASYGINLYHTPPVMAEAFAEAGDLANALEMAGHTRDHPLHRPLAFSNVVAAYYATPVAACTPVMPEHQPTWDWLSDMHSQILCAQAALPGQSKQSSLDRLRGSLQLAIASDIRPLRCAVMAQRARYATPQDIDALVQRFGMLAPSPWQRQRFAMHCAAAGLARHAVEMLRSTGHLLEDAWAASLREAPASSRVHMLAFLDSEVPSTRAFPYGALMKVLVEMSRDACDALLEALHAALHRYRAADTASWDRWEPLLGSLAVRAFELDRKLLLHSLLTHSRCGTELLFAARRLPAGKRGEFIGQVEAACSPCRTSDGKYVAFLVDLLKRDLADDHLALDAVRSITTDPDLANHVLLHPELADLFPGIARDRLLAFLISTTLQDLDASGLRGSSLRLEFAWMLPLACPDQLELLTSKAWALDNDFERDQAIIAILPYYAQRIGYEAARKQRDKLGRHDSQGSGWAALWPYMPEQERSRVFKYLVPEQLRSGGTEAAALLDIAASLPPGKLIEAVRWMIVHYRHNDPELLLPFVQAALRHPPVDALEIWEEILAESARLPCSDAVSWLESALPLADALGGATALAGIDMLLAKIAEQWPDRVAIKQSD